MLPLHTTIRSLTFAFFSLIFFVSCSNQSKKDTEIIVMLNETIVSSSQIISTYTKDILISMEEKLRDPAAGERAKIWYPKAKKIEQLSADILNYIGELKNYPNSKTNFGSELIQKLFEYKKAVLAIDHTIARQFEKSLTVFSRAIDSIETNQKNQNYFENITPITKAAVLNKLQNNVRIVEEKVIAFCHEQTGKVSFGPCTPDLPIVVQNSTIVQPGEGIEITAGICSFFTIIEPEVFVYEKPIPVGTDGVAVSRFKAESKPGKYYVPVEIRYTDQNGREQTIQKEIEYTVANIQKQ